MWLVRRSSAPASSARSTSKRFAGWAGRWSASSARPPTRAWRRRLGWTSRRPTTGYEDLLADPAVDVVHLASPNRLHYRAVPAGHRGGQARPLREAAGHDRGGSGRAGPRWREQAPVVTAVCYNVRFYPLCLEARQRIADGQLGGRPSRHRLVPAGLAAARHRLQLARPGRGGRRAAGRRRHRHALARPGDSPSPAWKSKRSVPTCRPSCRHGCRPAGLGRDVPEQAGSSRAASEPVAIDTEDYGSVLLRFEGGARGCFTVSQVTAGRKNCLRYEIAGRGRLAGLGQRAAQRAVARPPRPAQRAAGARPGPAAAGGAPVRRTTPAATTRASPTRSSSSSAPSTTTSRPATTRHPGRSRRSGRPPRGRLCEAILRSHREGGWVTP